MRRVCPAAMTATLSTMLSGSPAIRLKSLAVPSGTMPNGRVGPSPAARMRPLMTSLIVPSPPAAMTASKPASRAAASASGVPCPGVSVTVSSHATPAARKASAVAWACAFAPHRLAYGFRMTLTRMESLSVAADA